MLPAANAGAFVLASLALIAIPGPSVLFVVGRSLALGRWGGFLSVLGNALGMIPAITAVSLGVGAIVAESVLVFTIIKFAGAAYLLYLGVQTIRHRHGKPRAETAVAVPPTTFRLLRDGFVVGASNPKTIVFFVAVLPQFVSYNAGSIPLQLGLLGAIFFILALACDSIWALTAGTARVWFARSPRRLAGVTATGGVMMIGLGGALAITGNRA